MALIPRFEILNILTYISVDEKKIKIIMISAHAQGKQKQPKILQNRTCWPLVQIRSASKAVFHFRYIISVFLFNKDVKTLKE